MKLQYEIIPENLKVLEIKQIALDKDKLGALTFDKAYPSLEDLRKILVEFEELGYRELLVKDEVQDVDNYKTRLLDFINRIHATNPEEDASFNKNVRDQIETEIESFHTNTVKTLRGNLVYLRQQAALKSRDEQSLAQEQRAAVQARKQAEDMLAQLKQKIDDLSKREQQLTSTAGKVGARALGLHFRAEMERYQSVADRWLRFALGAYVVLLVFVIGILLRNTFMKEGGWSSLTWQEGAAKVALFTALWYGFSFLVRNYNVNSHLTAVNRHRTAVAGTVEDFLASNPSHTSELLQNATDAMFKHVPVGYITKAEKDAGNPLLEVVNKIINPRSDS